MREEIEEVVEVHGWVEVCGWSRCGLRWCEGDDWRRRKHSEKGGPTKRRDEGMELN